MARSYQTSIGRIVDPMEGLQRGLSTAGDIYLNYTQQQDRKAAQEEEKRRWEAQQSLREEAADRQRQEWARQDQEREFLKGYDPRIGELGGRGMSKELLEPVSRNVGADLQAVNRQYGLGEDKSLGQLSEQELADYRRDVLGVSGGAEGAMRQLADPSTGAVSQEDVQDQVFQDVLGRTGNATLATKQASAFGSPYSTRKEIQALEQARTDQANEELERRRKTAEFEYDSILDEYGMLEDKAKLLDKKYRDGKVTKMDTYKFVNEFMPDGWGPDFSRNDALEAINRWSGKDLTDKKGKNPRPVTNEEILKVLQDQYEETWFTGGGVKFDSPEEFGKAIQEYREQEKAPTGSILSSLDELRNDARNKVSELSKLQNVRSKSLPELRTDASEAAYQREYGEPTPEATVKPRPDSESSTGGSQDSSSSGGIKNPMTGNIIKTGQGTPAGNTGEGSNEESSRTPSASNTGEAGTSVNQDYSVEVDDTVNQDYSIELPNAISARREMTSTTQGPSAYKSRNQVIRNQDYGTGNQLINNVRTGESVARQELLDFQERKRQNPELDANNSEEAKLQNRLQDVIRKGPTVPSDFQGVGEYQGRWENPALDNLGDDTLLLAGGAGALKFIPQAVKGFSPAYMKKLKDFVVRDRAIRAEGARKGLQNEVNRAASQAAKVGSKGVRSPARDFRVPPTARKRFDTSQVPKQQAPKYDLAKELMMTRKAPIPEYRMPSPTHVYKGLNPERLKALARWTEKLNR